MKKLYKPVYLFGMGVLFLFWSEGNGYGFQGIFNKPIDPFTGEAITGGSVVASNTQPNSQS